jgi:hypothetical protein
VQLGGVFELVLTADGHVRAIEDLIERLAGTSIAQVGGHLSG